jgi:hypothetical protein
MQKIDWKVSLQGFILGVLLWLAGREVGLRVIPLMSLAHTWVVFGLLGAWLALTRSRWLLWAAGAAECLILMVIGYTPLMPAIMQHWVRSDPLQRADAVVALSANVYPDGAPDDHAQLRLFHAYELLGLGEAPRLVITRIIPPCPTTLPAVRRQVQDLGLHVPVEEVGPGDSTHDEAVAVGRLARRLGWKRVIVVTEPAHTRRAGAVFEGAGLSAICSPSETIGYHVEKLTPGIDRLNAFRDWVHEIVGYQIYRWRGWIR